MTEKQLSIINAAVDLFAEKGFAATTTNQIAKRAQVGEGTIFHYFKSKKELLLAIPDFLSQAPDTRAFLQAIGQILTEEHQNFEDFLRATIANRMTFAVTNVKLLKVMLQEIPFYPELRDKLSEVLLAEGTGSLAKAIDKFKAQGQIVDLPSTAIVSLLFTSLFGYMYTRYIIQLALPWEQEQEVEYLVRYIMHGLSVRGE